MCYRYICNKFQQYVWFNMCIVKSLEPYTRSWKQVVMIIIFVYSISFFVAYNRPTALYCSKISAKFKCIISFLDRGFLLFFPVTSNIAFWPLICKRGYVMETYFLFIRVFRPMHLIYIVYYFRYLALYYYSILSFVNHKFNLWKFSIHITKFT